MRDSSLAIRSTSSFGRKLATAPRTVPFSSTGTMLSTMSRPFTGRSSSSMVSLVSSTSSSPISGKVRSAGRPITSLTSASSAARKPYRAGLVDRDDTLADGFQHRAALQVEAGDLVRLQAEGLLLQMAGDQHRPKDSQRHQERHVKERPFEMLADKMLNVLDQVADADETDDPVAVVEDRRHAAQRGTERTDGLGDIGTSLAEHRSDVAADEMLADPVGTGMGIPHAVAVADDDELRVHLPADGFGQYLDLAGAVLDQQVLVDGRDLGDRQRGLEGAAADLLVQDARYDVRNDHPTDRRLDQHQRGDQKNQMRLERSPLQP